MAIAAVVLGTGNEKMQTKKTLLQQLDPFLTDHAVTYRDPYSLRTLCVTRDDWDDLVRAIDAGRPFHAALSAWTQTTNAVEVRTPWL